MPSLLAELQEEWLALQKETRRLWSEHKRHSGDADRASAVITLSCSELGRLSLLLRTGISQEDTVLYEMLIQSEQLRLKTAEAKLARSQRLQRAAKEEALESEEYERLAGWAFQAEQTWQSYLHGAKACATPQTYPESGHLTSRDASSIKAWRQAVEAAFADYANITVFSEPPAIGHCMDAWCKHGERKLKACACQIERAFREAKVNFKLERVRWHPDRFSKCENAEMDGQSEEVLRW